MTTHNRTSESATDGPLHIGEWATAESRICALQNLGQNWDGENSAPIRHEPSSGL